MILTISNLFKKAVNGNGEAQVDLIIITIVLIAAYPIYKQWKKTEAKKKKLDKEI